MTPAPLNTGRVRCGEEVGTAFLVAPGVALTARHVVLDAALSDDPIEIQFGPTTHRFRPHKVEIPAECDLIFLQADDPSLQPPTALECSYLTRNLSWTAFGFPLSRGTSESTLHGKVDAGAVNDATWDVLLRVDGDTGVSLEGLSGAPVIVDGAIRAVVIEQREPGLAAVSLHRIQTLLEAVGGVPRTRQTPPDVPARLRETIVASVPNLHAHAILEEAVEAGGYVVLSGEPGSGKSVVAGTFEPQLRTKRVIGRYFAGPEQPLPFRHRMSSRTFLDWLANVAALHTVDAGGASESAPLEVVADAIHKNLRALSDSAGKDTFILIVDGVDEAAAGRLHDSFIDLLPRELPQGVVIILCVNSESAFRVAYPDLRVELEVLMPPLSLSTSERVVRKQLPKSTPGDVASLAAAASGNPLVLTYVIRAFERTGVVESALSDELEGLRGYYGRIWARAQADETAVWVLAVLANARGGLDAEQIVDVVPDAVAARVPLALSAFRHLLRDARGGGLELYHLSLRRFLADATRALAQRVARALAEYSNAHGTDYAVKNRVHHLLGVAGSERQAVEACSQEWLDSTVAAGVEPEFALGDVDRCVTWSLERGDLGLAVRLLLLRSRASFRYDFLLAKYALELGRLALRLHGDATAADQR